MLLLEPVVYVVLVGAPLWDELTENSSPRTGRLARCVAGIAIGL